VQQWSIRGDKSTNPGVIYMLHAFNICYMFLRTFHSLCIKNLSNSFRYTIDCSCSAKIPPLLLIKKSSVEKEFLHMVRSLFPVGAMKATHRKCMLSHQKKEKVDNTTLVRPVQFKQFLYH
jgi:hypothetical protein